MGKIHPLVWGAGVLLQLLKGERRYMEFKYIVIKHLASLQYSYRTQDGNWTSDRDLAHDFRSSDAAEVARAYICCTEPLTAEDVFTSQDKPKSKGTE